MEKLKKVFSKIYDRYIDKIYRFIFLKVNKKEIAEDLTSETFLRCWKSFQEGAKVENPQAFLYQIARNLVTDYYRQKNKFQVISVENNPIADPRQNIEEKFHQILELEKIKTALSTLKDDYQNVIIWHYLDDLPIPKVARLLNKTDQATRVLLSRALASLKKKLTEIQSLPSQGEKV
jgi:RNA polymerase sigma-70 factor (ECF subfamily)